MPTRNLGRTGYKVGIFNLGGQASVEIPNNEKVAVPIIERALDLGVNYIDTSWGYGRGCSEGYIGQVMKRRRSETFLATKVDDGTRDGALRHLEESLKRLNTDHLDLWQIHNVQGGDDLKQVFGKNGALEAMTRARDIIGTLDAGKRQTVDECVLGINPGGEREEHRDEDDGDGNGLNRDENEGKTER